MSFFQSHPKSKHQWYFNQNTPILSQWNAIESAVCKMVANLFRPKKNWYVKWYRHSLHIIGLLWREPPVPLTKGPVMSLKWIPWLSLWQPFHFCDKDLMFSLLLAWPNSWGWVGLWGFLWWAPSAKRKDHHGVSFGWSSVWHRSNTGLSSAQYNMSRSQLYLGFGYFGWLPSFFGQ